MQKIVAIVLIFFKLTAFSQLNSLTLYEVQANQLCELPLHCIAQEYPNKLNQVLTDSTYINSPSNLHPVFYGCFDWHSAVHGHWLLARMLTEFPEAEFSKDIVALFDKQFTAEKIAHELNYFEPKLEKSFERTYGWAWLLKLYEALNLTPLNQSHGWTKKIKPLNDFVVDSYKAFLPKLVYPIRVGEHNNTAFGLSLAFDYAISVQDTSFINLISNTAKRFFLNDCDCQLNYEPSGFDFLSPCLQEAELMSKILPQDEFEKWIKKFLPQITHKRFHLEPGKVLDRTDGKLVHLDGLNFSRAKCFYTIGNALPKYKSKLFEQGDMHINTSINYVVGSDYMGSHWLATFLVYALEERNRIFIVEIDK